MNINTGILNYSRLINRFYLVFFLIEKTFVLKFYINTR